MAIRRLSDIPKVGCWIFEQNEITLEIEHLLCAAHLKDAEDPTIVYALFQTENQEDNRYIEDGIPFYIMHGYIDLK